MLEPFRAFLRGTKTSERLRDQPDLRSAIAFATGLETPVLDALIAGRDVVVTGSAGGGKTQLIHQVQQLLIEAGSPYELVPWDAPPPESSHVRFIPDLVAVPSSRRTAALTRGPETHAILVAANEGALSRVRALAPILEILHRMQSGMRPVDESGPVVVDLAGFDPFSGALEWILGLDVLARVVDTEPCCIDPGICPRKLAFHQLKEPEVRARVAGLLALSVGPGEVRFRQIWDLVGDMALGGQCDETPPTSPWFWRLFFGDSILASRVQQTVELHLAAMPGDDPRLFYGDWMDLRTEVFPTAPLLEVSTPPFELADPHRQAAMDWLHAQLALIGTEAAALKSLRPQAEDRLVESIRQADIGPLIGAINRYVKYQLARTKQ